MKVLIENAVPLNDGDAALIFGVGNKFEKKGAEVTYSTFDYNRVMKKYPNEKWVKSYLSPKILIKIPVIGFLYLVLRVLFSRETRTFDAIISAPGGYINSYYGFKRKLQLLMLYKIILNKKIYMYSQSIGPLSKKDEKVLRKYTTFFDMFFVRDNISKKRMESLGVNENVIQTKDAAFLLDKIPHSEKVEKKVAISVRSWKHDNRSEDKYIKLIVDIVQFFYKRNYAITFLSTCQGDNSYENDVLIAKKIFAQLPDAIKRNVIVNEENYRLKELRNQLTGFDYVVGTRLHMCILSWLSGTPALNISYEEKGRECYHYMDIDNYTIDYNFDGDVSKVLSSFCALKDRDSIFERLDIIKVESNMHFEYIYNDII